MVSDPYYFLIFGGIRKKLESLGYSPETDVIVVESISGAVGFDWKAEILRLAPFTWLRTRKWLRAYFTEKRPNIAYRSVGWGNPIKDLMLALKAFLLWSQISERLYSTT